MTKFELSISNTYVPDWGIIEAFRELFQNALDNEIENSENKMTWEYVNNAIKISNKTSELKTESLLLGLTTKSDNKNTIGKHGEGYKIAFMVLLRNNKKVRVYNYGLREIWDVRLVKSKKYNGQQITTVFVQKEAIWKKMHDSNLTIEVSDITDEEYELIAAKNLNLRKTPIHEYVIEDRGSILIDEEEAGNIYVKGLFINKLEKLKYGYNFEPHIINLDRDRKLLDSLHIQWETSKLWKAASDNIVMKELALEMFKNEESDVDYIGNVVISNNNKGEAEIYNAIASDFFKENGENAVPVVSTSEYEDIKYNNLGKPIVVAEKVANIIKKADICTSVIREYREKTVKEKLNAFLFKIQDVLTDEDIEEFRDLINEVSN